MDPSQRQIAKDVALMDGAIAPITDPMSIMKWKNIKDSSNIYCFHYCNKTNVKPNQILLALHS